MSTPCDSYHSIQEVMLDGEDVGEANSDSVRTVSEVVGEAPKDRSGLGAPEPPPATPAFFQVAGLVPERSAALGGGRDGSVARRPSTLLPEPGHTFRIFMVERFLVLHVDPT